MTKEINGVNFKVVKATSVTGQRIINRYKNGGLRRFMDLYKNPSQTKKEIYHEWCEFFGYGTVLKTCGNPMRFSIYAKKHTEETYYYITKSQNIVVC